MTGQDIKKKKYIYTFGHNLLQTQNCVKMLACYSVNGWNAELYKQTFSVDKLVN